MLAGRDLVSLGVLPHTGDDTEADEMRQQQDPRVRALRLQRFQRMTEGKAWTQNVQTGEWRLVPVLDGTPMRWTDAFGVERTR